MNGSSSNDGAHASREEIMSALFAHMVIQQTNMALMLLGRMPHPETGQTSQDLEGAKLFIDQLEMLEFKTRGNLDKDEEKILQQSLTALRMAFVDAVDTKAGKGAEPQVQGGDQTEAGPANPSVGTASGATAAPAAPAEEETRKKFSKKY